MLISWHCCFLFFRWESHYFVSSYVFLAELLGSFVVAFSLIPIIFHAADSAAWEDAGSTVEHCNSTDRYMLLPLLALLVFLLVALWFLISRLYLRERMDVFYVRPLVTASVVSSFLAPIGSGSLPSVLFSCVSHVRLPGLLYWHWPFCSVSFL